MMYVLMMNGMITHVSTIDACYNEILVMKTNVMLSVMMMNVTMVMTSAMM